MRNTQRVDEETDVRQALLSKELCAVHIQTLYQGLEEQFGLKLAAFRRFAENSIFFSEGATHKRLKRFANLTSRMSLTGAKAAYPVIAQKVVDGLPTGEPVNLTSDFSAPFVNAVVIKSLGLDEGALASYHRWRGNIEWLLADVPPWREVKDFNESTGALLSSIEDWFTVEDGAHLQASSFASFADELTIEEIAYIAAALLLGSIATSYTLDNALLFVFSDQDRARSWRAGFASDPQTSADRLISLSSAVPDVTRVCVAPTRVAGLSVPIGRRVELNLMPDSDSGGACPNDMPLNSLSFGAGRHKCVGEGMAREMVAVGMSALFAQFQNIQLVDSGVRRERAHPLRRIIELPAILDRIPVENSKS
ncbi:MAG: hypothetical protein AAFR71_09285 [Pseudomonadota bacterium]